MVTEDAKCAYEFYYDLLAGFHELGEYVRGDRELRVTTVASAPDAEPSAEAPPLPLAEVVWTSPDRLGGTPCFAQTRVPIKSFFEYMEGGETIDTFLDDFEGVGRAQALAALYYGKAWLIPAKPPQLPAPTEAEAEMSKAYRAMMQHAEETCRRGHLIYENELKAVLDTEDNLGRFLAIDVNTGDHEIGGRMDAGRTLRERRPDAVVYLMKIGYPAATKMGGSMRPLPR